MAGPARCPWTSRSLWAEHLGFWDPAAVSSPGGQLEETRPGWMAAGTSLEGGPTRTRPPASLHKDESDGRPHSSNSSEPVCRGAPRCDGAREPLAQLRARTHVHGCRLETRSGNPFQVGPPACFHGDGLTHKHLSAACSPGRKLQVHRRRRARR